MAFVGIAFNTLLRDAALGGLTPWVNVVHHMLMPLAVVDWILLPPRGRMLLRTAFLWAIVTGSTRCTRSFAEPWWGSTTPRSSTREPSLRALGNVPGRRRAT